MLFILALLGFIAKGLIVDLVSLWPTMSREVAQTEIAILGLTIVGIGVVLFMIFKTKPEK